MEPLSRRLTSQAVLAAMGKTAAAPRTGTFMSAREGSMKSAMVSPLRLRRPACGSVPALMLNLGR